MSSGTPKGHPRPSSKSKPCCWHLFTQPWVMQVLATQVQVIPRVCCHHGESGTLFQGMNPEDGDHGDFIEQVPPVPTAGLTLPGLIMPGQRAGHG